MNELLFEPISSVGELLRTRAVSSVELVSAALEQIAATDSRLNAFPVVKAEEALAQAEAADAELAQGRWRGPLHGLPVGVKDNIAVAGWVTTCGSPILAEHVTDFDAAVVERLRSAGAVVLGEEQHARMGARGQLHPERLRPDAQSLEHGPHHGRIERRVGGCGGCGAGVHVYRHGRSRIHPEPGVVLRSRGIETHARARQPGSGNCRRPVRGT